MIIKGFDEYQILMERMNREQCILTPIFRDSQYHIVENTILCVSVAFEDETYIISISHPDAQTFPIPTGSLTNEDINTLAYVHSRPIAELQYSPYVHDTLGHFGNMTDVCKIIPLTVWSTVLKEHARWQWKILKECPLNNTFDLIKGHIRTLREIEQVGLCVNREPLVEQFGPKVKRSFRGNMFYSQYNPYTTTGRPSNRFGGINFSALNKSDGTRDHFISRYDGGVLVQMDFEAYHLRLIADEYGVSLPTGSLHTELARKYFDTDEITDELYAASKQKTFEIMYGMSDDTYGIELFERVVDIRKMLGNADSITLPSGIQVDVYEPNPSKLFNYHVQSLEVVKTLPKLQQVLDLVKNTNNHLILYTYDSILLDMEHFDKQVIHQIVAILEDNKKFPVRIYTGTTYGNISEIRL